MQEMREERVKSSHDHSDLFSNLIAANAEDNEGLRLTDQEVFGNIFIFLIGKQSSNTSSYILLSRGFTAGHETTAHSLSFTMGLLAMYPEVQEKLYDHIVKNVSDPSGAPVSPSTACLMRVIANILPSLTLNFYLYPMLLQCSTRH
jgi:cytochrome P450